MIAEIRIFVKSCPVSGQQDRLIEDKHMKFHAVLRNSLFGEQELQSTETYICQ